MRDIESREDIEFLVEQFYQKLMVDPDVGHFFTVVVQLNLEKHLPVICDFWETILLDNYVYKGNPMIKHIQLHQKSPLTDHHFSTWLSMWTTTILHFHKGPRADLAISRAESVAELMKYKIEGPKRIL